MRVSREQFEQNRRTLLDAAGRLFKDKGFASVTVTEVMKSAGLTHGGFYSYFDSKDDLIAQAMAHVFAHGGPLPAGLGECARQYLTPAHRDNCADGCPIAALASETMRQAPAVRAEMTQGLERQLQALSQVADGQDAAGRRRAAIGSWSAMLGALVLARMSGSVALSDEILSETRQWLQDLPGTAGGSGG